MKIVAIALLVLPITQAFVPTTRHGFAALSVGMTATTPVEEPVAATEEETVVTKESVIELAKDLKTEFGPFLDDKTAKATLMKAVETLENSTTLEYNEEALLGDWDLVLTTTKSIQGIDTSQFPGPIKQIRESITKNANKYLKVKQVLMAVNGTLDRVDHVLSSEPPKELADIVDNLPDALKHLNTNPLDVSSSKLILQHKASIESETPLETKLTLKSIVWNVAGKSTYLDPAGKDMVGINLPWGDFVGSGTFETTYADEDLRVLRAKQGRFDLLRIFVKSEPEVEVMEETSEAVESTEVIDAEIEAPSDVEPDEE